MSIQTQPIPIDNTTNNNDNIITNQPQNQTNNSHSTSPSKNRRRRRKNNKNKNKNKNKNQNSNQNKNQPSTKITKQTNQSQTISQQTKIYSKTNKNPWQKQKSPSKFEHIINEQITHQTNPTNPYYTNETDLLEQQMILQAIAESNKLQKQTNNEEKSNTNNDEKSNIISRDTDYKNTPEQKHENKINGIDNAHTMSDEMLAIHLQKEEQNKLLRQQKMSEMYNGKYAKVTSSSVHPTVIPKSALKFYFDEDEKAYQQKQLSEEQMVNTDDQNNDNNNEENMEEDMEAISKHDAKIWSETHMNRLNEYETGGNLNTKMNIGNQCYNSFRNKLDKKGFITYHNYQLQPKDKKR